MKAPPGHELAAKQSRALRPDLDPKVGQAKEQAHNVRRFKDQEQPVQRQAEAVATGRQEQRSSTWEWQVPLEKREVDSRPIFEWQRILASKAISTQKVEATGSQDKSQVHNAPAPKRTKAEKRRYRRMQAGVVLIP